MAFNLSRDLASPHYQRVMWFYRQDPVKVSYHPVRPGDHRIFDNEDIVVLVYHVIPQDYVIKGSYKFMDRSHQRKEPSCQVWWPSGLW